MFKFVKHPGIEKKFARIAFNGIMITLLSFMLIAVRASAISASSSQILINNWGFEDGNGEWVGDFSIIETQTSQGSKACKINSTESSSAKVEYPFIPLEARTTYKLSLSLKRKIGSGKVYVNCHYLGESKNYLTSSMTWSAGGDVPVMIQGEEAVGNWETFSGTIRCDRSDFKGIRLVVVAEGGDDIILIDDIKMWKVNLKEAPDWALSTAVTLPGSPSGYNMAVEDVNQSDQLFTVVTTGAEFRLNAVDGILECYQKIETRRLVSTIKFKESIGKLSIEQNDRDVCVIVGETVSFGFQGDSQVVIATNSPLHFDVDSSIGAKHHRKMDMYMLTIDDEGGFSVMPYSRPGYKTNGSGLLKEPENVEEPGWTAGYYIAAKDMVGIAIFPPKQFDWKRSFDLRVVMTQHPPSEERLKELSKHANVLSIFAGIYSGDPEERYHAPYNIEDREKLLKSIQQAHDYGMKVLLYRHPMSYIWAGWEIDDAITDMKTSKADLGFDGWYLDGLFVDQPWFDSYRFIRALREDVGDGIIYTHSTRNVPMQLIELYCPFIDAYSDFILRGEGQIIKGPCDPYLRYVVGTYNISNSFATLKGDRMLSESQNGISNSDLYKRSKDSQYLLGIKSQIDTMLSLNGRFRWAYPSWPLSSEDKRVYIDYYYRELDSLKNSWKQKREPLPFEWPPCKTQSPKGLEVKEGE
jgi:hypothetical protein